MDSQQNGITSSAAAKMPSSRLSYSSDAIPSVLRQLLQAKWLADGRHELQLLCGEGASREGANLLFVYDLDALHAGLRSLVQAFPPNFLHCYAVKAAPLHFIVQAAKEEGLGVEAASRMEVEVALSNGVPTERIVFDSPAKTYRDLDFAIGHGIHINANCLDELDRIHEVITKSHDASQPYRGSVGLRINPLVGSGSIEELSVSTITSKFGVTLNPTNRPLILDKLKASPWLTGLHIHVGSQGFNLEQMAQGVKVLVDFAHEVDKVVGRKQIKTLDIGGGLSANYETDEFSPTYDQFAALLQKVVPELFADTSRQVITEYGRSLAAKAGWTVSRVEYAFDNSPGLRTALIHAGADVLLRECYCPGKFKHRITAYHGSNGEPVQGRPVIPHNIAGPLCFAGDVVSRAHLLPRLEADDLVVVHDTGANSLALFSHHCTRQAPAVLGYRQVAGGPRVVVDVLQAEQTREDALAFWGRRSVVSVSTDLYDW